MNWQWRTVQRPARGPFPAHGKLSRNSRRTREKKQDQKEWCEP